MCCVLCVVWGLPCRARRQDKEGFSKSNNGIAAKVKEDLSSSMDELGRGGNKGKKIIRLKGEESERMGQVLG